MANYNEVFTSILAMDSYHRDNNQGIFLTGAGSNGDNIGNNIGTATIILARNDPTSSFYAVAYKYPDGKIVISYRPSRDKK